MQERSTTDHVMLAFALAFYLWIPAYAHWGAVVSVLSRESAPAWVQAIGSVAAIAAGAFVVRWQVKEEARRERRRLAKDEFDAVHEVAALLAHALTRLEVAFVAARNAKDLREYLNTVYPLDELPHLEAAMRETELSAVPGPASKLAFRSGRSACIGAFRILAEMNQLSLADRWSEADSLAMERWRGKLSREVATVGAKQSFFEMRLADPEGSGLVRR